MKKSFAMLQLFIVKKTKFINNLVIKENHSRLCPIYDVAVGLLIRNNIYH